MLVKLRKLTSLRNLTYIAGIGFLFIIVYFMKKNSGPALIPNSHSNDESGLDQLRLCNKENNLQSVKLRNEPKPSVNSRTRQHALVFLLDGPTESGRRILYVLQVVRFKYHIQYGTVKNLPALIDNNKGRYATIIFEDADTYLELNDLNREMLDKYCLEYDVGVILFVPSMQRKIPKDLVNQKLGNFPLSFSTNAQMKDYEVNPESAILRVTRAGEVVKQKLVDGWTIFKSNHTSYEPVSTAKFLDPEDRLLKRIEDPLGKEEKMSRKKRDWGQIFDNQWFYGDKEKTNNDYAGEEKFMTVVQDKGEFDQIQRVIFGADLHFWMHKMLFLDALSSLSHGKLSMPLERYIQVDIDDIFVSAKGIRMHEDDVKALVKFQEDMKSRVQNFHFLLGFSGKFIYKGEPDEVKGDATFLKMKDNFLWFPHMWSHMQAHWFDNKTKLCEYMKPNKQFAERHGFNVTSGYAVAPHHSGIFPVHEPLYDCWKEIWGIETTSTEEYPSLRPDHMRRAFTYKGIKVLPRQTCGLFTHTNFKDKYPGGISKLDTSIDGGTLFQTFLLNRYNIYMTHFSNYGSDRLALYVFDRAVEFVQCWTNLRLVQIPSSELADRYLADYPDEIYPIWTNPCADKRHLEIWSKSKSCDRLPKFVIAGPQKTGTTALHWFLLMHPDLATSKSSPENYEEVQFFNGENYLKGLDWYMDFFPLPNKETKTVIFEKTANYFDQELVPRRLSALLPKAIVIILLLDPAKRAYSWYQHIRSHDDPTALQYSFYEVIKATHKESPSALLTLQKRCLTPGRYAEHLERWLEYVSSRRIILIDGELLAKNPIPILHKLQKSLSLPNFFNYSAAVRFDDKKGFFCQISDSGNTKCLGKGKGRQYPEMSEKSRNYLQSYYKDSNKRLLQIIKDLKQPVPIWLRSATGT